MSTRSERGVVFLTAPPELGRRVLADLTHRFPEVRWTVYFRVSQRDALGNSLDGVEALSDKPSGSKPAFLWGIRKRRYPLAVIAWTRHRDFDRMKLVGLLSGARRYLIYNENLESFYLSADDPTWLRHAQWRLAVGRGISPVLTSTLLSIYKWSIGLLIGGMWLSGRLLLWTVRRRLQANATPTPTANPVGSGGIHPP